MIALYLFTIIILLLYLHLKKEVSKTQVVMCILLFQMNKVIDIVNANAESISSIRKSIMENFERQEDGQRNTCTQSRTTTITSN